MDFDPYYPLKAGGVWVYRYSDPELPGLARVAFARRRVLSVKETADGLLGNLEERVKTETGEQVRELSVLVSKDGIREDDHWILRPPLAAATTWSSGPDTWRLLSLEETVGVPAGKFTGCVLVTYANEDIGGGSLAFKPGLGVVRAEQTGERGPFLYELMELP